MERIESIGAADVCSVCLDGAAPAICAPCGAVRLGFGRGDAAAPAGSSIEDDRVAGAGVFCSDFDHDPATVCRSVIATRDCGFGDARAGSVGADVTVALLSSTAAGAFLPTMDHGLAGDAGSSPARVASSACCCFSFLRSFWVSFDGATSLIRWPGCVCVAALDEEASAMMSFRPSDASFC